VVQREREAQMRPACMTAVDRARQDKELTQSLIIESLIGWADTHGWLLR
jgi:hypothetical protein